MLELDDAKWDTQIASDLKAGELNGLIANAQADMAAGTAKRFGAFRFVRFLAIAGCVTKNDSGFCA